MLTFPGLDDVTSSTQARCAHIPIDNGAASVTVFTIDEFLYQLHQRGELDLEFTETPKHLLVHGHCHQKALVGTEPTVAVLRLPKGYKVQEIPSGCCGMAGSFGYEAEHYRLSQAIGDERLFPAVRAAGSEVSVAASGMSCRHQIEHGAGRRPRHPIELLAEALG